MLYLAGFRLFTDLITNSTRLQTQIMTPAYNFADNTCPGVIHCLRTSLSVAKISTDSWSISLRYSIVCVVGLIFTHNNTDLRWNTRKIGPSQPQHFQTIIMLNNMKTLVRPYLVSLYRLIYYIKYSILNSI